MSPWIDLKDLPAGWFATPESREKWRPLFRERDRQQKERRDRARALFNRALASLPAKDAELVRKVYGL